MKEANDPTLLREAIERRADRYLVDLDSGWWHSIDLGDGRVTKGVVTLEDLKTNYARFRLPSDLSGQRVLDIGCWDGFYAFEAERHGAEVVAVDCFRPETFFHAREARRSRVEFFELSVYELSPELLGEFDIVFFQGVLYHLQHPLLGLQKVCEVTKDAALIGSYIIDHLLDVSQPVLQFYPLTELGGQYDNWCGPNSECLLAMIYAAGFVRTELLYRDGTTALFKAFRHWQHPPLAAAPSLVIREVANAVRLDRQLERRGRFALLSIWVEGLPPDAPREAVRIEVGGYGAAPVYIEPPVANDARINRLTPPRRQTETAIRQAAEQFTQIIIPVPPGLKPGQTTLQVYYRDEWSPVVAIKLNDNSPW